MVEREKERKKEKRREIGTFSTALVWTVGWNGKRGRKKIENTFLMREEREV